MINAVAFAVSAVIADQEAGGGKLTDMPTDGPFRDAFSTSADGPVRGIDARLAHVLEEAYESPQGAQRLGAHT